jgi:hypothetical protein
MALSSDTRKGNNAAENNKAAAEKAITDALGRSKLQTHSRRMKLNIIIRLPSIHVPIFAVLIQCMLCMKTVHIVCAHVFRVTCILYCFLSIFAHAQNVCMFVISHAHSHNNTCAIACVLRLS